MTSPSVTPEEPLEQRKAKVLRAIVSHYVTSGEPVGSKTLVERYRLGVSPATVRNDMVALEDAGYISQPHTSAGRIPTDAGYRFFVDSSTRPPRLSAHDAASIASFFEEPRWEFEQALRETATLLSHLTDHAALVFAPAAGTSAIRRADVVLLTSGRVMFVLVTDAGRVENHMVAVSEEMTEAAAEDLTRELNALLDGVPLAEAPIKMTTEQSRFGDHADIVAEMAGVLGKALLEREDNRVFLEGTSRIVDEHKFADLETVRQVIEALEHRRVLLEAVVDALAQSPVSVRIGSENPLVEMQYCSVVAAPYGFPGEAIGTLGVVGPTRMDYRRTIAAVYEVASNLGRMLTGPK
jgi:heat-inducible transcriptional repressor